MKKGCSRGGFSTSKKVVVRLFSPLLRGADLELSQAPEAAGLYAITLLQLCKFSRFNFSFPTSPGLRFASTWIELFEGAGMEGKLFTSPLSTLESAKLCSLSLSKLSTLKPIFSRHVEKSKLNISQERVHLAHDAAHSCSPGRWRLQSTPQNQSLPLLEDEDKQKWETCRQSLSVLNFSSEEADTILSKAFGWRHSPYWGEERSKEVPKSESVNETLDYLRQLGLSNDDLFKLIKKFPEVLGCCLDDELKVNVGILEKDWGIEGKTLRNLLLRNPKVLGYNVDCKGDCMAQCTRCWVRF